MRFLTLKGLLACMVIAVASITHLDACTGIKLKAKDGSIVHGRTLEFGISIDPSIAVVPRGYKFTAMTDKGPGLVYTSKYAAVGAFAFDNPLLMDGLNEKGLAVGVFYFPGFAGYTTITAENQAKALSPIDFSNWILTSFATIDEVKAALANVVIAPTVNKAWGNVAPPFHYIVYEKSGKSLVIEPIDGKLVTHDNPLGTFTNSPKFDWHITNLSNYINMSANNVQPRTFGGIELAPFGQGSGMVGIPGDFTPPSRFVRAAIFSVAALPVANSQEAIFQVFHILNNFDIPVGVARAEENGVIYSDYTSVTCARDPQTLKFYFKTYNDQTIREVTLSGFDLDAKAIKSLKADTFKQKFVDISSDLK